MSSWVSAFESEFSISPIGEDEVYVLIEGECRYLQFLGNIELALKVPSTETGIYSEFGEVAFLVNKWIKIQDSLEMIFNLLSGDSIRALELLSYLRKNKIPSYEFATYLFERRKVILVNRFTDAPSNSNSRDSNLSKIKMLVSNLDSQCHYLVVGDRPITTIKKWSNVKEIGVVYHPSGVVLNTHSNKYYETWYVLSDEALSDSSDNFSLSNFQRL